LPNLDCYIMGSSWSIIIKNRKVKTMSAKQIGNLCLRLCLSLILLLTSLNWTPAQAHASANPSLFSLSNTPAANSLPTIPTPGNPSAIVDDLNGFTKIQARSGNLGFDTDTPEKFGGDSSRLRRTSGTAAEYVVYSHTVNLTSLVVETYMHTNGSPADFTFSVSSNGANYTALPVSKTVLINPVDAGWRSVTYSVRQIPPNVRYVKIFFGSSANSWNAQISRVLLNYLKIVQDITVPHPRLMATGADFARVRNWVSGSQPDSSVQTWYNNIKNRAQTLAASPVVTYYKKDGVRLLEVSREVLKRMYHWGMVYQIEGNTTYLERAWQELEAVADFPNWNPDHFLDTAEMTLAVGVGYDWFYQGWSTARRETLRSAIVNLGFTPALPLYRGNKSWVNGTNNWNIVCNGGLSGGALALGAEVPGLSEEILQRGFGSIQKGLGEFKPDGAYPEGIGYWSYALSYATYYLSSLQSSLGTTYGLLDYNPGIAATGNFPIYMHSPKYPFNYGDAGANKVYDGAMFWLANKYNRPLYNWYQRQTNTQTPPALLWYNPALNQTPDTEPLDYRFSSTEVATFRSSWTDPNAIFVGFKGGDNQAGHNDLDLGTFVIDALGQRWGDELGMGDYNSAGYWNDGATGQRWNYYRKRAEGQNTLVISPSNRADQNPLAKAPLLNFKSRPQVGFAVADLTQAYDFASQKVQRGVQLLKNRTQVLVQDEITTKAPADVWWFMHTKANLSLSNSNRTAVFTKTGTTARLWATILTPGASFTIREATPLPTSPSATQQDNSDWQKLSIKLDDVNTTRLAVLLVPLQSGDAPPTSGELPTVIPLADWNSLGSDFIVTRPDGNNDVTNAGSLAHALANAGDGKLITFAPNITNVVLPAAGSTLPALKKGASIEGDCDANGPRITINGNGATVARGLELAGDNEIFGLKITGFRGVQLKTAGTNNKLDCVVVRGSP
jgi:hypothetical protein